MRYLSFAVCLFLAIPAIAADIKNDPLLAKIYAEARLYDKTTFATTMAWTSIRKDERIERIVRFDPAKPQGQRWTYISRNGKPPEAKILKKFAEQMKDEYPNGYATVLDVIKDDVWQASNVTETSAVYTLIPGPNSKLILNGMNMAAFVKTQMVVALGDKPFVKTLTMVAPKEFSPKGGVKVKALSLTYQFDRHASGEIVAVRESNKADAKVVLFNMNLDDNRIYQNQGSRVPAPLK
jgi:hypothetical protein